MLVKGHLSDNQFFAVFSSVKYYVEKADMSLLDALSKVLTEEFNLSGKVEVTQNDELHFVEASKSLDLLSIEKVLVLGVIDEASDISETETSLTILQVTEEPFAATVYITTSRELYGRSK